ncbi:MAG: hypothetical protein ACI81T_004671, partial [Bacteroidia bacterium]
MLVNHMMYAWDKGFHLKVAYAAPTYGIFVLFPIVFQTMAQNKGELYSYFNFMQMLLPTFPTI